MSHFYSGNTSYLNILIRMGTPSLIVMLACLFIFYHDSIKFIKTERDEKRRMYMIVFVAMHINLSFFSFFVGILEAPQSAVFFWFIMGICSSIRQIDEEKFYNLRPEFDAKPISSFD